MLVKNCIWASGKVGKSTQGRDQCQALDVNLIPSAYAKCSPTYDTEDPQRRAGEKLDPL